METNLTNPTSLSLNLGSTISDRLQYVAKIKNAMCQAIMMQVENDTCGKESASFAIYQSIYLEANYLEDQLKKL